MWKILTAASTALVLLGTPALAQEFGEWADDDELVDFNEFGENWGDADVFGTWDADDDDMLTADEWRGGMFDRYDLEDDEFWTEEEYTAFGDDEWGAFTDWDENEDEFLTADEFEAGVFGGYDVDEDEMWTEEEFGVFEDDEWF